MTTDGGPPTGGASSWSGRTATAPGFAPLTRGEAGRRTGPASPGAALGRRRRVARYARAVRSARIPRNPMTPTAVPRRKEVMARSRWTQK